MTVKHLFPAVEPSLNLDFANSKKLDPRITFTRSSTGTYVDSNGLIKTAAANEARFDHDPVSGSSLGLLVEESRTNVLYPSTPDYSGGYGSWSNGSAPLTANAGIAPDGTNTAVLTAWDTVSGAERMYYNTGTPSSVGVTEVHSFFVKAKTPGSGDVFAFTFQGANWGSSGTYFFDFDTETLTGLADDKTVIKYPGGWYRVSVSMTNSGTGAFNTYVQIRRNQQTGNWYIWGCQREDGSFPTSYIPTSGSTVTRSADVASMTGTNFSSWYNQSEGTLYQDCTTRVPATALNPNVGVGAIMTASGNVQLGFYQVLNSSNLNAVVYQTATAYSANLSLSGAWTQNVPSKAALAYKQNSFAASANGATPQTDSSGIVPIPNALDIGQLSTFPSNHIGAGTFARLTYYPFRLTDAQLEALTL